MKNTLVLVMAGIMLCSANSAQQLFTKGEGNNSYSKGHIKKQTDINIVRSIKEEADNTDALFHEQCDTNSITDIDGNVYKTIKIGNQIWMAENLKTTKYSDGTDIPLITNNNQWQNRTIPAYCWINNNEVEYKSPYGALYNWYTVNTNMLCPAGWHVPNNADWNALAELLGGRSVAGGKLKEAGVKHWSTPNLGATNESGFSALPGCLLDPSMSTFYPIGNWVIWWNSTSYNDGRAYFNTLQYDRADLIEEFQPKEWGFSVRCIQHLNTVPSLTTNFVTSVTDTSSICGGSRCADYDSTVIACGVCWSTSANPTINDNRTMDDSGTFNFTSQITGLIPNTKYYVRAYAINNIGIGYGNEYSFKTMTGTTKDIEGNLYKTVTIGSQIWMAENLRVTKYNNNTPINKIVDNNDWDNSIIGSYGWYDNNELYKIPYGALYNWYSVNSEMLCPSGWHVPTVDDWNVLADTLGGSSIAAIEMLESGGNHWQGNPIGTNESGFTAIPSGYPVTGVLNMDVTAMYWSKDEDENSSAWSRSLSPTSSELFLTSFNKSTGLSIRCVKDSKVPISLQSGLLAYYPFNGNANDESGNGNNGVVRGATLTSDRFGSNNSSYYFDTNYAFIQLPNKVLNNLPNASISVWIYWNGERPSIIMAKQHDWVDSYYILGIGMHNIGGGVDLGDTGRIYFRVKNSSSTLVSNSLLESNKWNHLAITIDQDLKLYINGILDAEISGSDFVLPDDLNATLTSLGLWLQDVRYSGVMNGNLDDIRFYNRALNYQEILALYNESVSYEFALINTPAISAFLNSSFEIPVDANNIKSLGDAVSCQFDFTYNHQKLQYKDCITAGTMTENGSIQINSQNDKLSIAWAGQNPLADSGTLVRFRFKALESGAVTPAIFNFLVNTDTIKNITIGTITITNAYGDVDGNNAVQAYDAALALQYSVGQDPLPDIDPLPWEDWRITAANVDNEATVSAYDASLILQYTVGLINSFPVMGFKRSTYTPQADVSVSTEYGYIVFRAIEEIFGLNVTIKDGNKFLGEPQILQSGMLSAINISSDKYAIGLATTHPIAENDIIMRIPINNVSDQQIIIDLMVNTAKSQIGLNITTGIAEPLSNSIEVYPNPANTILYFKNLLGEASLSIYDLQGRKVITGIITNNQFDISNLDYGLYSIRIENGKNTKFVKLIKH